MVISNNLETDIKEAPEWFLKSIERASMEKKVKLPQGNVCYKVWSANESKGTVILIHGTGASKNWWDPIAPLLLDKFNVIALDLPGMGDSDHCDVYSFENFGNSVLSIIKNEKLTENIVLVGHSLGGHVAGYVATKQSELIAGLVMIDTPVRPPNFEYKKSVGTGPLRMIKYYPDKKTILKRFRLMPKQECKNDWYLRYIAEHAIKETSEGWRWKFDDQLFFKLEYPKGYEYSFKCPSLFIAGEESLLMASKILDYMKNLIKDNMHFETIAGAAHHVPIDAPIEMTKIVKRALDKWL